MVISGEGALTRGRGGGGATTTTTTTTTSTTDPAYILMVPPPPDDGNCWFDQIIGIGWSILDQLRHTTLRNGNHCMTKIYVLDLIMRNSMDMTMKKTIKYRADRWHNLFNSKTWYEPLRSSVSSLQLVSAQSVDVSSKLRICCYSGQLHEQPVYLEPASMRWQRKEKLATTEPHIPTKPHTHMPHTT